MIARRLKRSSSRKLCASWGRAPIPPTTSLRRIRATSCWKFECSVCASCRVRSGSRSCCAESGREMRSEVDRHSTLCRPPRNVVPSPVAGYAHPTSHSMLRHVLPLAAVLGALPAYAQRDTVARAVRASQAPVIDGRGDEAVWSSAPPITAFRQFEPTEDGTTQFRTEARIVYDDRNLYVLVRA